LSQDFPSLVEEGLKIIDAAEKSGAVLRLMGGVAIRIHTKEHQDLYERLGRAPGDLDLMGYRKQSMKVRDTMKSLGYEPNQQLNAYHGHKRQLWYSKQNQIDILFNILEMCHIINFDGRLEIDRPTVSVSDLFLSKIQIVQLNEKDVKDVFVLLLEHQVGEDDVEKVNLKYLAKLLSDDWGFWYTTVTNLDKMRSFLSGYSQLSDAEKQAIMERLEAISRALKESPKSFRWKMRDRVGTKVKWYNVVEEVVL
jgi:hypothetical protein